MGAPLDPSLLARRAAERYPLRGIFHRLLTVDETAPGAAECLAKVISEDAILSARVRSLAGRTDAPWSHRRGRSLDEGIRELGVRRVHSAALLVTIMDAIPVATTMLDFFEFWRYSTATAFMTTSVAYHRGAPDRQMAFAVGLLHDVGRLVIDEEIPSALARIRDEIRRTRCEPWEAEQRVLGFPVLDVTVPLLAAWGLPPSIVTSVDGLRHGDEGGLLSLSLWNAIRAAKELPCVSGRVADGSMDEESAVLMTRYFGGVAGLCDRVDALIGAATVALSSAHGSGQ